MSQISNSPIKIFNTPLELGIRALIMLHCSGNQMMDFDKLLYLDHLCLNTFDMGGPKSLHPPIPSRGVQVYSKRDLLQKGITIMISKELINLIILPQGFFYEASEAGGLFLELFQTTYYTDLVERSHWVIKKWGSNSTMEIKDLIDENIKNWGVNFVPEDRDQEI